MSPTTFSVVWHPRGVLPKLFSDDYYYCICYLPYCLVRMREHGDSLVLLARLLGFRCLDLGSCGVFFPIRMALFVWLARLIDTRCKLSTLMWYWSGLFRHTAGKIICDSLLFSLSLYIFITPLASSHHTSWSSTSQIQPQTLAQSNSYCHHLGCSRWIATWSHLDRERAWRHHSFANPSRPSANLRIFFILGCVAPHD